MRTTEGWGRTVIDASSEHPGPTPLRQLAAGEVAVVVLRNLLPAESFTDNNARAAKLFATASRTDYTNGSLTTIGPYLAKYLDEPHAYFEAAATAREQLDRVGFDLAQQVHGGLRDSFGLRSVAPARESDGRTYPGSVIRIHADGVRNPLHNDNIMRDARGSGLKLADLAYQLSCVVCLQECDGGGELRMYQRTWSPPDETHKIEGGLGYDEAVVADTPVHEFKPQAGDVYVINPTMYHSIERVKGSDRLTMGFFMGFADERMDSAVVWG